MVMGNIQAHKSWKFLEIPSSIFLQVEPYKKYEPLIGVQHII